MVDKKGIIFSLEAAIALGIFISAFSFLLFFNIDNASPYKRFERLNLFAKDSLEVMSQMEVGDLVDDIQILEDQYLAGNIENNETSIIEVIGTFWSKGDTETAKEISEQVLRKMIPDNLNYRLSVDETEIYSSASLDSNVDEISQSNKLVSGLRSTESSTGFVARAFLEKINSKTFSSYTYFGGFVGQGDVTAVVDDVPDGSTPTSIFLEISLRRDVDLYINGELCQKIDRSSSQSDVVKVTITNPSCTNNILLGNANIFTFDFPEEGIENNFIGGGFLRIDYITGVAVEPQTNIVRYNFPGIAGLINLFDSLYVPGELQSVNAHLVFKNELTTFLNIGGEEIFSVDGLDQTQTIDISDATFSSILDYDSLEKNNIPIRLGFDIPDVTGTADIVLITDLSGSMLSDFDNTGRGEDRSCDDPLLTDSSTSRISLAKCLDKDFIDMILSIPGNRIALVGYYGSGSCVRSESLSADTTLLKSRIDAYTTGGWTCISCGINSAYNILNSQSDPSRQRFIVLMSDGNTNTIPRNIYDTSPCGNPGDRFDLCGGDVGSYTAADQTRQTACRAHDDLDSTIHTIGFGPIETCTFSSDTLTNVANCGNGLFRASDDPGQLEEIYNNIAAEILEQNYERQKITLTQDVEDMILSPDSYIEITFAPPETTELFGDISANFETDPFNECAGTFFVPEQFRIDNIHVTSYSGDYWTDDVKFRGSPTEMWKKVFLLSDFGSSYMRIGDPFNVEIPIDFVKSGSDNQVDVRTGSDPNNENPSCSQDNRVIYTALFNARTAFSPVSPTVDGNIVKIYFNKGNFDCTPEGSIDVKAGLTKSLTVLNVEDLNPNNAVHYALSELLDKLNFVDSSCDGPSGSGQNPIDIEITPELKIETASISNVPSLWGPLKFSLITWA